MPALWLAVIILATPFVYSRQRDKHLRNFRVVEEGVLYRSAQLSPAGLDRIVHDYGIRTIVSFRDAEEGKTTEPPDKWEEEFCRKVGVNYVRIPAKVWSYDRGVVPAEANVRQFNALMADPKNHPVLVHCFRGVHRTGAYCAIVRMERHGWSNAEAIAEMKELGYDNIDREDDVRTYLEQYRPVRAGKTR